jgi:pantoate--beta-alanine ligase
MPKIIESISEMRRESRLLRVHTRRVALVPTMGYLHRGHVSLLEAARRTADVVVLSIFVNPSQFGPNEDLARYPRDLDGDVKKAESAGTDLVFTPTAEEMYPAGYQTWVDVRELSKGLCGDRRPGHFVGVATVVLKLLQIVEPEVAFFGEKDYQQLQVIRRMARDLNVPVEIVGLPLVREPDGLAMSSRNAYLSSDERAHALSLSRALFAARDAWRAGERDAGRITAAARAILDGGGVRLDYLELRDAASLATVDGAVSSPAVLAVAAFVGRTRLIDNVVMGAG